MAYSTDKKPSELTALTTLATDDTFIVGDTSDATEVVKTITKANLLTDLAIPASGVDFDPVGTDNSTDVTLGGTGTYITIAGQVITVDPITESDISDLGAYITNITGSPLSELSDVTITTIASGEVLKWNGSAWINQTLTEAGIQAILTEGAFVDGDKTKLDTIETSADVTDTTNVTAAGALMDSEVTNLAQVKAFDSTDYATAAQGSTADAALPATGGTMTGDIALGTAVTHTSSIKLNNAALNDETWSGTTIAATAGATLAVGDVCYLASSGKWVLVDGILDGTDTGFSKKLGICVLASTDTNPTEILLDGVIASAAFPAFTVGSPVYLSDTAGELVVAQPSTTNFAIRIVGYAVSATVLHFQPSQDYIVHV